MITSTQPHVVSSPHDFLPHLCVFYVLRMKFDSFLLLMYSLIYQLSFRL